MFKDSPIDIVITYVDNTELVWQSVAAKYDINNQENNNIGAEFNPKRFRSWENLKYWFRGISQNMEFVRTIHLVVSNPEQVPSWLNAGKVHIVLHRDIIPEQYLPTFNSTTIEMFLCRIPGLAERFLYFNDDMFVMNECSADDFFDPDDGYPYYELIHRTDAHNSFRMQCKNSYRLACKASETKSMENNGYFYIRHSCDPMIKSDCLEIWDKEKDKIEWSLTKFRQPFNFTQYLFPDYSIMLGHWHEKYFDFAYFKMQSVEDVCNEIEYGKHKVICLNDSNGIENIIVPGINDIDYIEDEKKEAELENMKFMYIKEKVLKSLERKFHEKCEFEI